MFVLGTLENVIIGGFNELRPHRAVPYVHGRIDCELMLIETKNEALSSNELEDWKKRKSPVYYCMIWFCFGLIILAICFWISVIG